MKRFLLAITCAAFLLPALACKDEGAAEKLGQKVDDAADRIRYGDEGKLEKAGRQVDEAFDEVIEDAQDELEKLKK